MVKYFLILILLLNFGWAEESGYKKLQHQKLESFTFNGFLETYKTDFREFLEVNGQLAADKSRFLELKVNGEADLHECILYGPGIIRGKLTASHSVFEGPLEVTAKEVVFARCLVSDITINPVGNFQQPQIVKVNRGSVIYGNIVFESKGGEVHLSRDSRILGGVVGGTICPFVD